METLRTQDSENVVNNGWPSLRFEVTAAQSEVIGQKPEVLQKSEVLRIKVTPPILVREVWNWINMDSRFMSSGWNGRFKEKSKKNG